MNEERTGKCLRQVKHIRGHYKISISKGVETYSIPLKELVVAGNS